MDLGRVLAISPKNPWKRPLASAVGYALLCLITLKPKGRDTLSYTSPKSRKVCLISLKPKGYCIAHINKFGL